MGKKKASKGLFKKYFQSGKFCQEELIDFDLEYIASLEEIAEMSFDSEKERLKMVEDLIQNTQEKVELILYKTALKVLGKCKD
ncbi:MAG: hypothetical protein LBS60_00955 [Deltaproteobacteria bacterium]|jgi:hypothetical protein|nr:hypothetical protein [Deltaproteobacteria bacterium]